VAAADDRVQEHFAVAARGRDEGTLRGGRGFPRKDG
jgi:hypothetical protein